jgi:periplasmic protein TonB
MTISEAMRGEEGAGMLRFVMDGRGRVLGARVVRSSGHEALDAEMMAMLERAAPLPPIPPELGASRIELSVPVSFALR